MDIISRFLQYTKINTTTNRENGANGIMPSSKNQMELALLLKSQLEQMGLENVKCRPNSITTATLKGNTPNAPKIAFFAHLDTSCEQTNDTKAKITHYTGGDICLNEELGIFLKQNEQKELQNYIGDDIIHTDGTSLLGADDKAAIAAIMDAIQTLKDSSEPRGDVIVAFLPDEEQGLRGAKALDISEIDADFGYCLDCCGIGELIYENWNAGDCVVEFIGASAHPMNAKGNLKNSLLMAHKFISMLPHEQVPEATAEREGYFWVKELSGNSAKTTLKIDIREFDDIVYEKRLQFLRDLADACKKLWGDERIKITLNDRYKNVFNALGSTDAKPIVLAKKSYEALNITPKIIPMRGGYDGSVISAKGLACPNLFTGAHNFHSIYEYLPVKSLKAASNVIQNIVKFAAKNN